MRLINKSILIHYKRHILNSITPIDPPGSKNTVGIMNMLNNPSQLNEIRRAVIPNPMGMQQLHYMQSQQYYMPNYMGYPMMPFQQMQNLPQNTADDASKRNS